MEDTFITALEENPKTLLLSLSGTWTIDHLSTIEPSLDYTSYTSYEHVVIDGKALSEIDTSGAWLLLKAITQLQQHNITVSCIDFQKDHATIIDMIQNIEHSETLPQHNTNSVKRFFEYLGHSFITIMSGWYQLTAFFGQMSATFGHVILHPFRLRLTSIVFHINEVGLKAVPIVALLAFLISIVLGYQGALQLQLFGAEIFTINLVAVSVLREMGVLITAIMVAGRSGSAFTAQIGVMQVNEEIDAMRTMGLDPYEVLVLPRMFAILIALPMLTFIADIVGLFGTWFAAYFLLDMSYLQFMERLDLAINIDMFFVGMVKAPVFAVIIGMVGCMRGMEVRGSAEQVGNLTTISVVQSIFLVIFADAIFSVVFSLMGI